MDGERFGKYRLIKKIAAGGMAEIFYARIFGPSGFAKDLVVKKILPNLADQKDFIDMFADEARIVARMNHPNIVQVFDFGSIDNQYYIAMEYVNGRDLRQVIDRHKALGRPMDVRVALAVVRDVARALQYAHSMRDENGTPLGVIHRDVTPRNILISFQGGVKLTDFGVAKARARISHTRTGIIKGKFGYMAPEQVTGREVDSRMDIFSLSSVLWETMALKRLFSGNSEAEILGRLLHQTVPSIQEYCPEHSRCVQELLNEGLAKDPDMRFQSASELDRAARDCMGLMAGGEPDIGAYMKDLFGVEEPALPPVFLKNLSVNKAVKTDIIPDEETLVANPLPEDETLITDDVVEQADALLKMPENESNFVESGTKNGLSRMFYAIIIIILAVLGIGIWTFRQGNNDNMKVTETIVSGRKTAKTVKSVSEPVPVRISTRESDTRALTNTGRGLVKTPVLTQTHSRRHHAIKYGKLTLSAIPWALVWIDGKKQGVTPVVSLRIRAGRHRIKLKMGKVVRKFRLNLKPGRTLKKIVKMGDD